MNYVELAEKFAKEETVGETVILNNKILGAKMQAKIKATEAAITEREIELELAINKVEKAKGTLTKDVDYWVSLVRDAEYDHEVKEDELAVAERALAEYEDYADLFVIKE